MKIKLHFVLSAVFAATIFASCNNEQTDFMDSSSRISELLGETNLPIVHLDTVSDVHSRSATFTATIESLGDKVTRRGFIYSSTNATPTYTDGTISLKVGTIAVGSYSTTLSRFTNGAKYYVRAFALNTTDTVYSNVISFIPEIVAPTIETQPVINRVRVAAIACGVMSGMVSDVAEYGVCVARTPFPTISDKSEIAPDIDSVYVPGQFGVLLDALQPKTMYHVRAYAKLLDGKIIYGQIRIFSTTNGGSMSWGWSDKSNASADVIARIETALDSAKYYYNNYSNLAKYIYANYNSGVATADCTIGGWMRFGPVERYQWVGTAQHEISHAMGVGTASNWDAVFTSYQWNRPCANQALRVMMKDMTTILHLSGIHFWPGGINQREEVTTGTTNRYGVSINNARMLKLNAMVLSAMREDGLTSY
ncbi:MAG: hypothetical protein WCQ86_03750 [Bacteroidaceae bacterium]